MTSSKAMFAAARGALVTFAVFLFAFGVRYYYDMTALVESPIRGDAVQYCAYAWNLANHGVFSMSRIGSGVPIPDGFRDPGFPVFLALLMKLVPDQDAWYGAVLIAQAALGALTVWLTMVAGKGWLPRPIILTTGLLLAVWPHAVVMAGYLLSETLFSFLALLALACLAKATRSEGRARHLWSLVAGLSFAAAGLTNAVFSPIGPIVAVVLVWRDATHRKAWLGMLVFALLPILAWQARGMAIPTSESAGHRALMNFVQGSWPEYHDAYAPAVAGDPQARATMKRIDDEYRNVAADPHIGVAAIARRFADSPGEYLAWYAGKPWLLWSWRVRMGQNDIYVFPTHDSPYDTQPVWRAIIAVCVAMNPLLFVLALSGIVLVFVRSFPSPARVAAFVLLFCSAVYTVLQAEPRYSAPLRPFEMLMAACVVASVVGWIRARREHSGHFSPTQSQK